MQSSPEALVQAIAIAQNRVENSPWDGYSLKPRA
jgi:hypothetical protein